MKINESTIRDFLRESLFGHSEPGTINVNSVVDPSAAVTDPLNTDFKPQNGTELKIAVNNLIDSSKLGPEEIFDIVKDNLKDEENEMGNVKLESVIRKAVRKMLAEADLRRWRDVPTSLRDDYVSSARELGILGPGESPNQNEVIPANVVSHRNEKMAAASGKKPPRPLPQRQPRVSPAQTPADKASRLASDKKFLQGKLGTMEFDKEPGVKDQKDVTKLVEKVQEVVDSLRDAVIETLIKDLKRIVDDYNNSLKGDDRFKMKPDVKTLDDFLSQYVMFMSHANSSASDADWPVIQAELEKLHTRLMDPSYYVLYSGEKLASDIKVVGQSLRSWLIDAGKKIKELDLLRDPSSGSKRINISSEKLLAPLRRYLERLGLDSEKINEIMQDLSAAYADESNANMTNILSQKIVTTAFITRWENEVLGHEAVDGISVKDLFPEKSTSRAGTFAQGASDYASSLRGGATPSAPRSRGIDVNMTRLITLASDILASDYEWKEMPEMSKKLGEMIKAGGFSPGEIDEIANVVFDPEKADELIARLTQPGMNPSYDSAGHGTDTVLELIQGAIEDSGTVEAISNQ